MKVPYVNLALQHKPLKGQILRAIEEVLNHGMFVLGDEVHQFEQRFAAYCQVKYAVGVNSGTDALVLAMKALGIGEGDEVITVPNSFLATASSIILAGARPVFVDVGDDYNINPELVEPAISKRTKAILPVHLTGHPAEMTAIMKIARKHHLRVTEDGAQAVGAKYKGKRVGGLGDVGCFSFHPLKNLNAVGDGGVVTTNQKDIYEYLLKARNHGLRTRDECQFWGYNSRLDTIQAAILKVKMKYLDRWIKKRRKNAEFYRQHLAGVIQVPEELPHEHAVYHTFIVQADRRDKLQSYLEKKGIGTKVHYPIPIHQQEAARSLGYKVGDFPVAERQARRILSLPIYPELTSKQREYVVRAIRNYYAD